MTALPDAVQLHAVVAAVDGLRTAAGLAPLADYLAEMAEICGAAD